MREKILEVSSLLFAQKGYSVSLSEIAILVGIKKQSIYNYFESKDSLFYEVINREILTYFQNKEMEFQSLHNLSAKEKLEYIYYSILKYFEDINKLKFWKWSLLIESENLSKMIKSSIALYEENFMIFLKSILENGIKSNEIKECNVDKIIQSFLVLLRGNIDSRLYYDLILDFDEMTENSWYYFKKVLENP